METSKPDLELARQYAEAIKKEFPDQLLAYNCSPSFNWKQHLDDDTIARFQRSSARWATSSSSSPSPDSTL